MYTDIPEEIAENPWFKIVEFLQRNRAVVIKLEDDVLVVFYGDTCGVFDEMPFPTRDEDEHALRRNGFSKFLRIRERRNSSVCQEGSSPSDRTQMEGFTQADDFGAEEAKPAVQWMATRRR